MHTFLEREDKIAVSINSALPISHRSTSANFSAFLVWYLTVYLFATLTPIVNIQNGRHLVCDPVVGNVKCGISLKRNICDGNTIEETCLIMVQNTGEVIVENPI